MTKTPDQLLREGMRMKEILADDLLVEARALMERRYYEEFKRADSSEERVRAWAKANLLDDFWNLLHDITSRGEHEVAEAKRALKSKEQ